MRSQKSEIRNQKSELRAQKSASVGKYARSAFRKLIFSGLWLLTFSFIILSSVLAQSTGGAKGKVRNMSDVGIAGATIAARQNGQDLKTVKSDAKGNFVIDGLSAGVYNIAFEARGYSAAVQYNVEIKAGKIRDLGGRLILMADRGSRVILKGSVFSKEGYSAAGAKIEIEKVNADGTVHKIGETMADSLGEFSFTQPEGPTKIRIKASFKDFKGSKDVDVDSAMVYRFSVMIEVPKPEN